MVPAATKFLGQIEASWNLQKPLREHGHVTGLMLVILGGVNGLYENVCEVYNCLRGLKNEYYGPIITMLSCTPFGDIDFLHEPERAMQHVKKGVEFADSIPLNVRKIVSFHLNSLVSSEEFFSKPGRVWRDEFQKKIGENLFRISVYAKSLGVDLVVETVPVPEYGDAEPSDTRTYRDVPVRDLYNPYYLTWYWGIDELKKSGLGICLDVCHSRTIYESVKCGIGATALFHEDLEYLTSSDLLDDVCALNGDVDVAHINDGLGIFDANGGKFVEGVALGDGDIKTLDTILLKLAKRQVPMVIEVNEPSGDFKNRPETKKSIEYLLSLFK